MTKAQTVLVTGGAGFLGSHLCFRLHELGYHVICVDDLSTGFKDNISTLLSSSRFHFLHKDITTLQSNDIESVDHIYHLACPASPKQYQKDPVRVWKTCTFGTSVALELARVRRARLLFTSTSEVYGDPLEHPQTESYRGNVACVGPRACYDEGKRAAETLCYDFHRQYGVDIRIARIFNTYGSKMASDDGRVVSNLIVQALRNKSLTIYGDGTQTRSFCYVDDLVEGLLLMMRDGVSGDPINLGSPTEITILQLAEMILRMTRSKGCISYCSLPQDDPPRRKPDIRKAMALLQWQPTISLEEGVRRTVEWFSRSKQ